MTLGPFLVILGVVITLFSACLWYMNRSLQAYSRAFTVALTQAADQHAKFFSRISGEEAVAERLNHFYARMEQQASATNELRRDLDAQSDRLNSHLQRFYRLQRTETDETGENSPQTQQQELEALLNQPPAGSRPLIRQPRRW